jgi:hypothetical protein
MCPHPKQLVATVAILTGLGGVSACRSAIGTSSATGVAVIGAEPDCTSQVRFHGVTYTAYRLTRAHLRKVGVATPTCSGQVVPGAHAVPVWSLGGHSPQRVLLRRTDQGRFAVYVADSLTPTERGRLLRLITAR